MTEVALFVTCLTDSFYPRVGQAVTLILDHLGCDVKFPSEQTCCGQPMYNNGYHDDSRDLAQRMIRVFEDYEYVVTPSGSCASMIREHYPELLHGDAACEALCKKTYEFTEFLTDVLKVDLMELGCRWEGKLTYHYSCHLRALGLKNEAVDLLKTIQGVDYVEMEKLDQCCGFGGTFAVKYPEISGSMVRDKIECIVDTRAEYLICNDGGCTMNIAGSFNRQRLPIKIKHIAEVIAEGLELMPREESIEPHMDQLKAEAKG